MILSDELSVRGYTDPATWATPPPPAPTPAAPVAPVPVAAPVALAAGVPVQERAPGLVRPTSIRPLRPPQLTRFHFTQTDQQQQCVLELQGATRLTYTYSHMCLEQNGWDPAVAFANFKALASAGSLPPDAFVQ